MARPLPKGPRAVLEALRFDRDGNSTLAGLSEPDLREALAYCDRNRLTLLWYTAIENAEMPDWLRQRLVENERCNRVRLEKLLALCAELDRRFAAVGVAYLVIKGPAQWPDFCGELSRRMQYDLDIYCPAESLTQAAAAIAEMGYEPLHAMSDFPTDHLPVMIRRTGWEWRNDFFDVEIPIAIEVHFQFWDRQTERFGPGLQSGFWERRVTRCIEGVEIPTLDRADTLAYTCQHALRHLLRGDSRPVHLYEAAWFLEHIRDEDFWSDWRARVSPDEWLIQGTCFALAQRWFGCRVPEGVIGELPAPVRQWCERWGDSPLAAPFRPNKDELWLHLNLVDSTADRLSVLRRRLIPLRPPGPVGAVHVPDSQMNWRRRLRNHWSYLCFVCGRVWHHARVLVPALGSGLRWWLGRREIASGYWRFYGASMLFNFALFTFYLLYNLLLAEAGYREDFIGLVTSAMAAGSLAGSFSANLLVGRIGLRGSLMTCFAVTGIVLALRVLLLGKLWLLALAFLGGACQSLWAVCLSPTVAALTTERNRSFVFGLTFSSGVGLGIAAGAVDGWLPSVTGSIRNAIWLGCAFAPLAVLPLLGLPLEAKVEARAFFRPNRFLVRFLAALAVWGIATGSLEPFFNVYFAKGVGMTTAEVGVIFSLARIAQVIAMLLAPLVLRRFGLVPGIALMQLSAAVCMATLGLAPAAVLGALYCGYTAFHYMSEPGVYSLLMKGVPEEARTSASAWNFVVLFGSHAVAAAVAGAAIARVGYPPVLLAMSVVTVAAAGLFFTLLREQSVP